MIMMVVVVVVNGAKIPMTFSMTMAMILTERRKTIIIFIMISMMIWNAYIFRIHGMYLLIIL